MRARDLNMKFEKFKEKEFQKILSSNLLIGAGFLLIFILLGDGGARLCKLCNADTTS